MFEESLLSNSNINKQKTSYNFLRISPREFFLDSVRIRSDNNKNNSSKEDVKLCNIYEVYLDLGLLMVKEISVRTQIKIHELPISTWHTEYLNVVEMHSFIWHYIRPTFNCVIVKKLQSKWWQFLSHEKSIIIIIIILLVEMYFPNNLSVIINNAVI